MRKLNTVIKRILIITLLITFAVVSLWITLSSLLPPNKEKMEKYFQQDKDNLSVIVDYLSNLEYAYVSIDKFSVENRVMFTGANTRYQEIDNKTVLESLKKLLNNGKYNVVGKNGNTVFFQKWKTLCGV